MNIIFYTSFKLSPTKGGTERTTLSVIQGLSQNYGCKCYSVYSVHEDTPIEKCLVSELHWENKHDTHSLSQYIRQNNIDIVVLQGAFALVKLFKKISAGLKCKILLAHHFEPGWETHFLNLDEMILDFPKRKTPKEKAKLFVKMCLFPLIKWSNNRRWHFLYRQGYNAADRVILLSKNFIPQFMQYASISDNSKFTIIPNGLSYGDFLPLKYIDCKQNIVLIVSRLTDPQKRISLAIKIWQQAKKDPRSKGWHLNIVGHGAYEKRYKKQVSDNNIQDITFLGRQEPHSYYEAASIFLMTSSSEGWGLTLTEAQQFGVVPIAFDSFASLRDIVTDGEDGILVPECDIDYYVAKLLSLMDNKPLREQLAANAIQNCQRFSQDKIANKWWRLFNEV